MQARTDQEIRLVDFVERLGKHRDDRTAVHLHLSRLRSHHRREHHIRIAANSFENLIKRFDGQLFALSNNDLVFVAKEASHGEIDEVVTRLRYLFSEDPLTQTESYDTGEFCSWYDLLDDYDTFLIAVRQIKDAAEERRNREAEERRANRTRTNQRKTPMKPENLGRLVEQIGSMDLSSLLRRQPVCALAPNGELRPVFNEMFVSIGDLQRMVMPDIDLAASMPLFSYLTRFLDQRILRSLPELEQGVPLSTSININIETILSPQFLEFDHKLRALTRKTIVLEIQPSDLFADVASFMFARDFVRNRGYRMCMDGLNHLTFPLIDKRKLQLDMQKLLWSADALAGGNKERVVELKEAIRKAGPSRVILCRCDSQQAFDFGAEMGISLYQGRLVDQRLAEDAANRRVA